jgi:Zn-dependent protease
LGSIDVAELLLRLPVVLLALTVHEFCHAYFALRMGDPTAYQLGRCTLNPMKHLDPLGFICILFAPIGWARPVPINPFNFPNRRQGILVATAAGPISNLVQAVFFALMLRLMQMAWSSTPSVYGPQVLMFVSLMRQMFLMAVMINVGLAVFNCLPLYPLDGFHISMQLMRPASQQRFIETARFGPYALLGLILLGNMYPEYDILSRLVRPPVEFVLVHVAGLSWF